MGQLLTKGWHPRRGRYWKCSHIACKFLKVRSGQRFAPTERFQIPLRHLVEDKALSGTDNVNDGAGTDSLEVLEEDTRVTAVRCA